MPISHRHKHSRRDLYDAVGDMVAHGIKRDLAAQNGEKVELVKNSPQNENNANGAIPTAIEEPTRTKNLGTAIAKATGEASMTATNNFAGDPTVTMAGDDLTAPTSEPSSSSSSSSDSDDASGGLSAGATAGIVFAVLGGLLLIGLIVYFAVTRGKSKPSPENASEKFSQVDIPPPPPNKDGRPPRLSLRPVTQFFPGFNMDRRTSKGAAMTLAPASAAYGRNTPSPNPFDRAPSSNSIRPVNPFGNNNTTHPANPFGSQAERAPSPISEEQSLYSPTVPPTPNRNTKPHAGRHTSMNQYGSAAPGIDFTLAESARPASPAGTVFSMSSVAPGSGPLPPTGGADAIAAAGGPQNTTVHRVQLDFKPSLADEMELKGGDLVRLLHEYDDGWALCIRLDRSQQGVVPRTCLSTRPVKPRTAPRGPPVNPQGRPGQRPMGPQGRPESPVMRPGTATGSRPASPAGFRSQSPMGRPMSPANGPGSRSQSPNPRYAGQPGGRPRAPSKAHGPSPMNPGYGQALPPGQAM